MNITFDAQTSAVLGYVQRTISHGVPERVALVKAERKFGVDRHYLRALVRLARP